MELISQASRCHASGRKWQWRQTWLASVSRIWRGVAWMPIDKAAVILVAVAFPK